VVTSRSGLLPWERILEPFEEDSWVGTRTDVFYSIAHSLFLALQDTAALENLNIQLITVKKMARGEDS
jgi:hypothetical protein